MGDILDSTKEQENAVCTEEGFHDFEFMQLSIQIMILRALLQIAMEMLDFSRKLSWIA